MFERLTSGWPGSLEKWFTGLSMVGATALLFVAAQAGFIDGPRVLANMALDRWFPSRFAALSDRFVTQNGVLLMGGAALIAMLATRGAVGLLVVLYSINVFATFSLSQIGMVRHWWQVRATETTWKRKLAINGVGLGLTSFILVSLCVVKFHEGGWVTLFVTGALIGGAFAVQRHYGLALRDLKRLEELVPAAEAAVSGTGKPVPKGRTAIVLVNGFNGLGLHNYAVFALQRIFCRQGVPFVIVPARI